MRNRLYTALSERILLLDGGEDGRYAELLGSRIPEYAYRLGEVGRL